MSETKYTAADLKEMQESKEINVYEQVWEIMKCLVSSFRGSSLGSDSEYADGRRTAFDEMYTLIEILEKTFEVKRMTKDWTGNKHAVFVTNGASNHTETERVQSDFYATDPKAVDYLLEVEKLDPMIWECACGEGHLSKRLEEYGYEVYSSDLIYRGYGVGGLDFLKYDGTWNGDIVTNPPYKYALEFCEKALSVVREGGDSRYVSKAFIP